MSDFDIEFFIDGLAELSDIIDIEILLSQVSDKGSNDFSHHGGELINSPVINLIPFLIHNAEAGLEPHINGFEFLFVDAENEICQFISECLLYWNFIT